MEQAAGCVGADGEHRVVEVGVALRGQRLVITLRLTALEGDETQTRVCVSLFFTHLVAVVRNGCPPLLRGLQAFVRVDQDFHHCGVVVAGLQDLHRTSHLDGIAVHESCTRKKPVCVCVCSRACARTL